MNGKLIDNLHKVIIEENLEIPDIPEMQDLIKELRGLENKTREECIEYLDKCTFLRALCIAIYPIEEE